MAYNWTTGKWELDNSLGFDWTKAFSSMSMNGTPSSGTIKTGPTQNYIDLYSGNYNYKNLGNWNINLNKSKANQNLISNDHSNAQDLTMAAIKNYYYTNDSNLVRSDLQNYFNQGNFATPEDYVNAYNNDAKIVRNYWSVNHNYGDDASKHNPLFRKLFPNRSLNGNPGKWNIGYLSNLENELGSSTWLRRMDWYENEFDINNPDSNRIHEINFGDKSFKVYKKANGDIGLLPDSTQVTVPTDDKNGAPVVTQVGTKPTQDGLIEGKYTKEEWDKLMGISDDDWEKEHPLGGSQQVGDDKTKLLPWYKREGWVNLFNGFKNNLPNLIEGARYAGALATNRKIYEDSLKGIRPNLMQSYNTYRQVVGDEASKQAYYRRGAEGITRASLPFTSDADRLMAYQMEAQRQANELQALGDLIDNQRIRETSELSAQHADANRQRATEVANQNIAQINAANQARWNLSAQRRAADWTATNNLLLGYENRLRQKIARREAIYDNIDTLIAQSKLENDKDLLKLQSELDALLKDPKKQTTLYGQSVPNWSDPDIVKKQKEIKDLKLKLTILVLLLRLKSGGKVTYKLKDDLLYKTARDAVKHFREMTKLTDNSYLKSRKKVPKLVPHPTKKLQQGGVAPFVTFTPLAMGGEYSQTAETSSAGTRSSSSSKSDDKSKDLLTLAKDLFSKMEGLPIDVSSVYAPISNLLNRVRYSGEELSSHEIATIYLLSMTQLSALKHNQKIYEAAKTLAINNDALDEFVITNGGKILSLNVEDGSLKALSFDEIAASEGKYNPLTNNDLLELRAHDPKLAFDSNILSYVSDTIGINKVTDEIKKLAGNIGTDEVLLQGYSKKQADNIVKGLELLLNKNAALQLQNAPDGDYEYTETRKSLQNQMNAALNFILTTLPRNMLNTLKAYADMHKVKPIDIIVKGVSSLLDSTYKLEWNPVTGKAAKDANGNSKNGTDTPSSVLFLLGNGYLDMIEFNIGNSQSVKALGRFGILQDTLKHNLGQGSTFKDVSASQFGPILDLDKATFGGSRLNVNGFSHIVLNNSDCVGVDLPVTVDRNGNYIPDFLKLKLIELAEEIIQNNKITDKNQINKIYKETGLSPKYDNNGNLITHNYKRFAAIKATLDSKAIKGEVPINLNEVSEADEQERELYIETMQKNGIKDYDLDDGLLWTSWGKDKLYKGTIFIPIRDDLVGAYISGGNPLDTDLPNNANSVAIMQHAPKINQYVEAPTLSSLK